MPRTTPERREHGRQRVHVFVGFFAVIALSCATTSSDIASDACDLARGVMSREVGVISAASQANGILRDARAANISLEELLRSARQECPDVVEHLPF